MIKGIITGVLGVVVLLLVVYFALSDIGFTTAFVLAGAGAMFGFALGTVISTLQIRMGANMATRLHESEDNTKIAHSQTLEHIVQTIVSSTLKVQYDLFKQAQKHIPQSNHQQPSRFPPLLPLNGPVIDGNASDEPGDRPHHEQPRQLPDGSPPTFDSNGFRMTGFDD